MFSISNSRRFQGSFLMRLLQTTGLSLALMTASAAGVHAEVQGAQGVYGGDGVNPGDPGGNGGPGGDATDNEGGANLFVGAAAMGGDGGNGGNAGPPVGGFPFGASGGSGGEGGAAKATAATTVTSGSAGADAEASGGNGGSSGLSWGFSEVPDGGTGGAATAFATGSSGNGNATVSASATGGSGAQGDSDGGFGGGANATGTAMASGSGDALSSVNANGGAGAGGLDENGSGGDAGATSTAIAHGSGNAVSSANATGGYATGSRLSELGSAAATAEALAAGGGKAIAAAVATGGQGESGAFGATSNAETVNGAMAQALSTDSDNYEEEATSTAKTSFAGVIAQSKAGARQGNISDMVMTDAVAQGGSGQAFLIGGDDAETISTALPDQAYAGILIGGATNVADALLGPHDKVLGTAILHENLALLISDSSSTFDFHDQGDLLVGVIDASNFSIFANGIEVLAGGSAVDTVIDLGFRFGPNIELTFDGSGTFAFGGAVPEPSTWGMMLLGFAGLGFAGYRKTCRTEPQAA